MLQGAARMRRMSRRSASRGPRFAAGLARGFTAGRVAVFGAVLGVALGGAGLQAQETVDLPGEDQLVSPDLELVYAIGSAAAAAEWEQFTSISGIAFDGASNLYLLDGEQTSATARVVVVDAAGGFVNSFGRAGDGPGEFRAATQLVVWEDGQILVEDMLHAGYHVFSSAGEFERMVREGGGGMGFAMARRPNLRPERTGARTLIGRSGRTIQRVDMSSEDVEDRVLAEAWAPVEDDGPRSGDLEDMIDEEWGFEPDLLFDALPSGGGRVLGLVGLGRQAHRSVGRNLAHPAPADPAAGRDGGDGTGGARTATRGRKQPHDHAARERTARRGPRDDRQHEVAAA